MNRSLNMLLIEDDEIDVITVQRAVAKSDMTDVLLVAGNGIEGLDILRGKTNEKFPAARRLVLLDLNMPKMGGIEFLRELRADPTLRSTAVVVLTTSDEERDKVEAYDLNVAGYIVKPVTPEAFIDTMKSLQDYWSRSELP